MPSYHKLSASGLLGCGIAFCFDYYFEIYLIEGQSMQPTLWNGTQLWD